MLSEDEMEELCMLQGIKDICSQERQEVILISPMKEDGYCRPDNSRKDNKHLSGSRYIVKYAECLSYTRH